MYDEKNPYTLVYNEGDVIAITVKPDDKIQQYDSKLSGVMKLQEFHDIYRNKFERLFDSKHYDYRFNIEISEPIGKDVYSSPRMHLHGIVKLKTRYSVMHWLMDVMPDLLQHARLQIQHYIETKQNTSESGGWLKYCVKQERYIPVTVRYLGNHDSSDTTWLPEL